jgi:allophanate hydrolase
MIAGLSFDIGTLSSGYQQRQFTPVEVVHEVLRRIAAAPEQHVWIARLTEAELLQRARALLGIDPSSLPLYGIPFAIKDNIDLAGVATTAACPAFSYQPAESAPAVQRLIEAGAIPVGKTNLDQFATGLVGTRSPYGTCRNSFDPAYISGGSSSGSAVAVAMNLVSFALGTDTAGSGRVPAAFNNIVGYKPTCGLISPRGMVNACRTIDTLSVLAFTAEDAAAVAKVAMAYDAVAAYSRPEQRAANRGWARRLALRRAAT